MNCPMCVAEVLQAEQRDGIELDVCPRCRGIWLDRGELEKLAVPPKPPGPGARRYDGDAPKDVDPGRDGDAKSRDRDDDDDDDDDDWRPRGNDRGRRDDEWRKRRKRAKKGFGERLADVFDDILD